MLEKMSEENREQQLTYLNSLWNHMLQGISEKRNLSVEQLNALADEVQTLRQGDDIVETGLVDEAKYKDQVLDDLREITETKPKKGVPVIDAGDYAGVSVPGNSKTYSRNKVAVIYASGDIGAAMGMGGEVII